MGGCKECGSKKGKLVKHGFCADCWDIAQYREEYGDPCRSCKAKHHHSLLKNGLCSGCTVTAQSGVATGAVKGKKEEEEKRIIDLSRETSGREGVVYVYGSNAYGQCGLGPRNTDVSVLSECSLDFGNRRVVKVAAGLYHSAFLVEGGSLVMAGRDLEGQIAEFKGIVVDVACGNYHTAVIDEHQRVFEWGRVHGTQPALVEECGLADLIACGGNSTTVFNSQLLETYMWGWAGGRGHVNRIAGLSGRAVDQIQSSKWECHFLVDGMLLSVANKEVATEYDFKVEELQELGVLQSGLASVAVGSSAAGAVTLTGEAITWKRDHNTGDMVSQPVSLGQPGDQVYGIAFSNSFPAFFGPNSATLGTNGCHVVQGTFQQVVCGGYHCIVLSGHFRGSTSFALDAQGLFFSKTLSDCSFGGIPAHRVFLEAAGLVVPISADLSKFSDDILRAFCLYCYTERLLLHGADREKLLVLVEALGNRPLRLYQILTRQVCEPPSLASRLVSLLETGDVELECDLGVSVRAHLALLVARSPYFAALASGRFQRINDVIATPYSASAVQVFCRFCCGLESSHLDIDADNVVDVLQLANEWNVTALLRAAETHLIRLLPDSDSSNFSELLELAELFQLENLIRAIKSQIGGPASLTRSGGSVSILNRVLRSTGKK